MKTKKIDGINLNMQLWDTSGKERFRTLTSSYYNKAKGILVVFDITNLDSFGNVRKWIQDIKRYAMEDVSLILIGNKSDLVKERRVSFQDGKEFAEEYGIKYIETSAKSSEGLDNAFNCLARMIIESKSNQDLKDMDLEVDIKDSNVKDLSSSSQNHDENKFPEMDNASFDELMQYKLIDLKKCCKKKGLKQKGNKKDLAARISNNKGEKYEKKMGKKRGREEINSDDSNGDEIENPLKIKKKKMKRKIKNPWKKMEKFLLILICPN